MLAEPIMVPDGDSFLQLPIQITALDLPALPDLTYLQVRRLHLRLSELVARTGPWAEPVMLIDDPALPELPKLDRPQALQLVTSLERVLQDQLA